VKIVNGSFCNALNNRYYILLSAAWGYHRQGYCQAGFSAAATKVKKNMVCHFSYDSIKMKAVGLLCSPFKMYIKSWFGERV
jgi:hypothetical protein